MSKLIITLLIVFGIANAISMPKELCNPLEKVGETIAAGVIKCMKSKMAGKTAGKASALLSKVTAHVAVVGSVTKSMEKKMAVTMTKTLLHKVGCPNRRLGFLKNLANKAKKAGKKALDTGKKMAKPLLNKAKAMACKAMGSKCPMACKMSVDALKPYAAKLKVPTECAAVVALDTCKVACHAACK